MFNSRPGIRVQYGYFEESQGRIDVARAIFESVLILRRLPQLFFLLRNVLTWIVVPGHIETILSWANFECRHGGLDAAIDVYRRQIESTECDIYAKGALTAEWARLLWKVKGKAEEARQVYQKNQHWYLDSRYFWINYLQFEMEQPTSAETEPQQYERIHQVIEDIRKKSHLPPSTIKDLAHYYMVYLLERGGKDAAKEYLLLDREVNGRVQIPLDYIPVKPLPLLHTAPSPPPSLAVSRQNHRARSICRI